MTCSSSLTVTCVQLAGGPVQVLIEALQDLGLSEGVRLLRNTERQHEKHNIGNTHTRTCLDTRSLVDARQPGVSPSNQIPPLTAASAASRWRRSRSRWPISEQQVFPAFGKQNWTELLEMMWAERSAQPHWVFKPPNTKIEHVNHFGFSLIIYLIFFFFFCLVSDVQRQV